METPPDGLFIVKEISVHRIRCDALRAQRQPDTAKQGFDACALLRREQSHLLTDIRRTDHADGDRFTMTIPRVACLRLDGVGDRMSEIEDAPKPTLVLVARNDVRLDLVSRLPAGVHAHRRCVPQAM